ncbi:MAG TPA: hypothetical protein VKZ41_11355 [Gemmatimonadales bacterium]|nr:hypothetical protein [Gemmatimonadales bacterium]
MRILGIVLIVLGVIGLVYGGISYTRRSETVSVGPVSATIKERESLPIPPVLGAVALLAGIGLLVVGSRNKS